MLELDSTTLARAKAWIARRPIPAFIGLTFAISYAVGIPFNLFTSGWASQHGDIVAVYLPRLLTVYGPALSAVTITWILSGRPGVSRLLGSLQPQRHDVAWYLFWPSFGASLTLVACLLSGVSWAALSLSEVVWSYLIVHLIAQILVVGVGEELGWRGWLLPHFLQSHNRTSATVRLGVIWGVWHLPILLSGLQVALPFVITLASLSALFTWVWSRVQGRTLVLAVAHASVNAPMFFLENVVLTAGLRSETVMETWAWLSVGYAATAVCLIAWTRAWWLTGPSPSPSATTRPTDLPPAVDAISRPA